MPTVTDLPSAQKGNFATRQKISTNAVCGFFFKVKSSGVRLGRSPGACRRGLDGFRVATETSASAG